jgi:sensor histidine kinase YesM
MTFRKNISIVSIVLILFIFCQIAVISCIESKKKRRLKEELQKLQSRIHELEQKTQILQQEKQELQQGVEEKKAQVMLSQIEPHFIYNALAAIRYLVKKDAQAAYDGLYEFSRYLQSHVESMTGMGQISWQDEFSHIEAYVHIEQMRLGEKLKVVYEMEEEDFLLPSMLVEPLVENAISHGIAPKEGSGTVWIRVLRIAEGYQIEVEDDGIGFDAEHLEEEKRVGIGYIRTQLQKLPGSRMQIDSQPGKGTKVQIILAI